MEQGESGRSIRRGGDLGRRLGLGRVIRKNIHE
jgi:hypothetical protein